MPKKSRKVVLPQDTNYPGFQVANKLARYCALLGKQADRVQTWDRPEAVKGRKKIQKALGLLEDAGNNFLSLGDWRPRRGGRRGPRFTTGDMVSIKPRYQDLYEDLLEPGQLISVIGVKAKYVRCDSVGETMTFPSAHLKLVKHGKKPGKPVEVDAEYDKGEAPDPPIYLDPEDEGFEFSEGAA